MKVKRLTVTNVSGIPLRSDLNFDGKSLYLYGENGTGKSSYVRAIEWLVTGEPSGFPYKPGGGYDTRIRNKDHEDEPSEVEIELTDGSILRRVDQELDLSGTTAAAWHERAKRLEPILRRRDLLAFITSKDSDRYTLVEEWIGLGDVHRAFMRIKEALAAAKKQDDFARSRQQDKEEKLRLALALASAPQTFEEAVESIRPVLDKFGVPAPTTPPDVAAALAETKKQAPTPLPSTLLPTLDVLEKWTGGAPAELPPHSEAFAAAREAHTRAKAAVVAHASELLATIDAARVYFAAAEAASCPVCEQDIERNALRARLDERRALFTDLENASRAETETAALLQRRCKAAQGAWSADAYCGDAAHAATYVRVRTAALDAITALAAGEGAPAWAHTQEIKVLMGDLAAKRKAVQEQSNVELLNTIRQLEALTEWPALVEARTRAATAALALARASELYAAAQDARHRMFNQRLAEITAPIKEFYKSIHPDEDVEDIQLKLPLPTGGGNKDRQAELVFSFTGQSPTHPVIHLSEGHLDTLGLAFFLMNLHRSVTERGDTPPLLVLDDVISSVDATHRTRIATEILKRFADWQVFITTHDRVWYKRLCKLSGPARVQVEQRTIRHWTREAGPHLKNHRELRADLEMRLANHDAPHVLVGTAGIMLEEVLNEVRQHYELKIRAKLDDRYTLGDMYPHVAARLEKTTQEAILPGWHAENPTVLQDLNSLLAEPNIRNVQGAHYSQLGEELPEAEAERFARAAIKLRDAFYCPECTTLVAPITIGKAAARCSQACTRFELEDATEVEAPAA